MFKFIISVPKFIIKTAMIAIAAAAVAVGFIFSAVAGLITATAGIWCLLAILLLSAIAGGNKAKTEIADGAIMATEEAIQQA